MKNQKGYAILFTIVIVSAISVITAGLANTAYKQLVLSSLAKDSQSAFYQADTAGDCALYADMVEYGKFIAVPKTETSIFEGATWNCGGLNLSIGKVIPTVPGGYELNPPEENSPDPCFRIVVTKTENLTDPLVPVTDTKISAKGYNICDKNNLRTVEREIQINY